MVIFGDSYSTFSGHIPSGYETWYYDGGRIDTDVTTVEQTWWKQLMKSYSSNNLLLNNSWSGSTICNTGYNGADVSSWSFIARADELINDGYFNNNNVDTIIVFGGTNDSWAGSPLGEIKYSDWTDDDLDKALPAFCYLIDKLKTSSPDSRIVCVLGTGLTASLKDGYLSACQHYGVETAIMVGTDLMGGHPTIKGMKQIKEQIIGNLLN